MIYPFVTTPSLLRSLPFTMKFSLWAACLISSAAAYPSLQSRQTEDHSWQAPKATDEALLAITKTIDIEYSTERVLNLKIPRFSKKISGQLIGYGFLSTSGDLDLAMLKIDQLISRLLELAELEKTLELLANEIEKTRRRVNALEYILIPSIDETIKFINLKLSEIERADLTRLMRVKEIVRSKL